MAQENIDISHEEPREILDKTVALLGGLMIGAAIGTENLLLGISGSVTFAAGLMASRRTRSRKK